MTWELQRLMSKLFKTYHKKRKKSGLSEDKKNHEFMKSIYYLCITNTRNSSILPDHQFSLLYDDLGLTKVFFFCLNRELNKLKIYIQFFDGHNLQSLFLNHTVEFRNQGFVPLTTGDI